MRSALESGLDSIARAGTRIGAIALLAVMLSASTAPATQVTLRLVDQLGDGVAGSQFSIASQSVSQDGSVTLEPGTYALTVMPAINGNASISALARVDAVEVGAADTLITIAWNYADLTLRLEDQDEGVDSLASFHVPNRGGLGAQRIGVGVFRLPVTVDQSWEPSYSGVFASGYPADVGPSINGKKQVNPDLERTEAPAELGLAGLTRTFVWKRADLTLRLEDQDGGVDSLASFHVPNRGGLGAPRTGVGVYRLPVTVEQPGEPSYYGVFAAGYPAEVGPSINGKKQVNPDLERAEAPAELDLAGLTRTIVWKWADLTLRLEDQDGGLDSSASFHVPSRGGLGAQRIGVGVFRLPVTVEQGADPSYYGVFATGYPAEVGPSINGKTQVNPDLERVEAPAELDLVGLTRTIVWKQADLTLRLEDQDGGVDSSASFYVPNRGGLGAKRIGVGVFRLPVTVEQPGEASYSGVFASGYPVGEVGPSINGKTQVNPDLVRTEAPAELDSAGLTRTIVWKRADLTLRLEDQDGGLDSSASFHVPNRGGLGAQRIGVGVFRLPVTVEQPGDPSYSGVFASGYPVGEVGPSINGKTQVNPDLVRSEAPAELDVAGLTRTIVWKRADLTLRLEDQDGGVDSSASFHVPNRGGLGAQRIGVGVFRLPVTVEQGADPSYYGVFASGYPAEVGPSINGKTQANPDLERTEVPAELGLAGLARTIVWKRADLTLRLEDQDGRVDSSASFHVPNRGGLGAQRIGVGVFRLPVTVEQGADPSYYGVFATGYPAEVGPSINGKTQANPDLERIEVPAELGLAGLTRNFVWEVATGPLSVVDSGGTQAPGSAFCLPFTGCLQSGVSVSLPVTEDPAHPATEGVYSDGYDGSLRPRLGVAFTGPFAFRLLPGGVFAPELVVIDTASYGLRFNADATPVAAQLQVSVVGPPLIRANHRTAFELVLENQGTEDAVAVPLWLAGLPTGATVEPDFVIAPPPIDGGEPDWSQLPLSLTGTGGRYMCIVVPRLPPGVRTQRLYLTVPATDSAFQLTAALTAPWADVATLGSCLADGGVIQDPACMGSQLASISASLASTGIEALSAIGLWAKVAWQCEGAATLQDALARAGQVLDLMLRPVEQQGAVPASCGEGLAARWNEHLAVAVGASVDPNDKLGTPGTLSGQQAIPYTIRFENDSTATLPALRVRVEDALDRSLLDVNTVSLGAMIFGEHHTLPPPGLTSYVTEVDLRPGRNVIVRVEADLNRFTGVLSWALTSLDPATCSGASGCQPYPPESVQGFLPPNNAQHEGEGQVRFTVLPLGHVVTGSELRNDATITFDGTSQVTPEWANTLDNTPPASRVLPLGPTQDSAAFTVHWETVGVTPDLHDFTIYVAEDSGAFRAWRRNTAATADTFAAHPGHAYRFFSVARDSSGNVEPVQPESAAQTVQVVSVPGMTGWRLELSGAMPNPARGDIRVGFTLSTAEPAALELYDVAGRQVLRREVGALGQGPHVLALGSARMRPGLYFMRLRQGAREVGARVVLVR